MTLSRSRKPLENLTLLERGYLHQTARFRTVGLIIGMMQGAQTPNKAATAPGDIGIRDSHPIGFVLLKELFSI